MAKFYVKIASLLLLVGFVLLIVGLSTPYWLVTTGNHQGLWKTCWAECDRLDEFNEFDKAVWAPRLLNIFAIVTSGLSFFFLLMYLHRNDGSHNLRRIKSAIVLCILSGIFIFVGIAVYVSRKHHNHLGIYDYGYSFMIVVIAGVFHFLLIMPLILEIRGAASLGAYESI